MKVEDECEVIRKTAEKMSKARLRYINNQVIKQKRRSNNPKSEKRHETRMNQRRSQSHKVYKTQNCIGGRMTRSV